MARKKNEAQIMLKKKRQFVWNFVWKLPSFLANGSDQFKCFCKRSVWNFSQIDNFKSLKQNSKKWGIRDLFESFIFAVFLTLILWSAWLGSMGITLEGMEIGATIGIAGKLNKLDQNMRVVWPLETLMGHQREHTSLLRINCL